MDKTSASGCYQKPASSRRVRLIPATPLQEPSTPTTSSSSATDTTQPLETSSNDLQSRSPRGVMRRVSSTRELPYPFTYQATHVRNEEITPPGLNSLESVDNIASLSDTQAMTFLLPPPHMICLWTSAVRKEEGGVIEPKGRGSTKGDRQKWSK